MYITMQVSPTTVGGPITSRRTSWVKYVTNTIPSLIETSDLPCVVHRQSVQVNVHLVGSHVHVFCVGDFCDFHVVVVFCRSDACRSE